MPGIVKVKVMEGYDLPVMDRASDLTDAFVEIRIGNVTHKTDVFRKSLNPQWYSEWFKFEVDDEELQGEYLQVKVLDYDVYSSHDSIGKVNINLDLLVRQEGSNELCGSFPIYDTLHGIRGYIRLKVRAQFFTDTNKYRHTSCGVQFFSADRVPSGYTSTCMHGFVEELLVINDPEYQWIDKIRTPRASNEARIRLFTKLTGEIKRKIGLKVLESGGNAVIGYQQHFDLEGEMGVVVRAIGTSVSLQRQEEPNLQQQQTADVENPRGRDIPPSSNITTHSRQISVCSEYDPVSEASDIRPIIQRARRSLDEVEFPFYTISTLPLGFVLNLCGMVSSRSVKLLNKVTADEVETREGWWRELRLEIRSHTKAMGCHAVVGYREYSTLSDDLVVLSAYGTAAVLQYVEDDRIDDLKNQSFDEDDSAFLSTKRLRRQSEVDTSSVSTSGCHLFHVPYAETDLPLHANLRPCMYCKQDKVPEILLSTTDIPEGLAVNGSACLIQARVIRLKKKEKEEANAENVSQILPFLEFDLHQQLISKLKVKGMNAVFGLKSSLTMAEQTIIGVMTGTGIFVSALPPPRMLVMSHTKLDSHNNTGGEDSLPELQKRIMEMTKKNRKLYKIKDFVAQYKCDPDEPQEHKKVQLDLSNSQNNSFVELNVQSDSSLFPLLIDPVSLEGFHVYNTEATPGCNYFHNNRQFVTVFKRIKIPMSHDNMNQWLANVCDNLLQGVRFKMRLIAPCCLMKTAFHIGIDDDEYFHVSMHTFVSSIDTTRSKRRSMISRNSHSEGNSNENVKFVEKQGESQAPSVVPERLRRPTQPVFQPAVTVTSLSCLPNMLVTSYLGNLNIFLIRENTDVKEEGGLHFVMQQFMYEIQAIIRAHVLSLNGNAILSFFVNEIILTYNPHKNQAQCLVNVSGDVACIKESPSSDVISAYSTSSDISSSPCTPNATGASEAFEEFKYKLDRAVFGTNV